MTARSEYDDLIRDRIGPRLRELGFRKQRNVFRRSDAEGWQLVEFQASQWGSRNDVQFTINLAAGVAALDPSDSWGIVRIRIGELLDDGEDRWWHFDAQSEIDQIAAELLAVLTGRALPWLDQRRGLPQLLDLARRDPDGFPRHALGRFASKLAEAGLSEAAEIGAIAASHADR